MVESDKHLSNINMLVYKEKKNSGSFFSHSNFFISLKI